MTFQKFPLITAQTSKCSCFTDWGLSPSLPRISCIPSVDTTWKSIPQPRLPWKTPACSVCNCTPNTPLFLPALSFFFFLIKQYKDKLSIHIKFIHYSDILCLGCLLMKQTHTNPYNNNHQQHQINYPHQLFPNKFLTFQCLLQRGTLAVSILPYF